MKISIISPLIPEFDSYVERIGRIYIGWGGGGKRSLCACILSSSDGKNQSFLSSSAWGRPGSSDWPRNLQGELLRSEESNSRDGSGKKPGFLIQLTEARVAGLVCHGILFEGRRGLAVHHLAAHIFKICRKGDPFTAPGIEEIN